MTALHPNFFIVGAPKCGTTALYTYLGTHPDIFFPADAKEPHHYNEDMPGFRWYTDPSDYLELFDNEAAQNSTIRGEASVQYLYSKVAAANIARDAPGARILICLRDVVPFVRSYHNQMLNNLDEDIADLQQAWHASGQVRLVAREGSMLDYKSIGFFSEQIDRYRAAFPDDQIRVMYLEDFIVDPRGLYQALLAWLGLDDDGRVAFPPVHAATTQRSRALAGFIKSPPPVVRRSVQAIKRVAGVQSLGLARKVQKLNVTQANHSRYLDPELVREIESHYASDQQALAQHEGLVLKSLTPAGDGSDQS